MARTTAAKAIQVRMYRQGLGDCFLLTFPRKSGGEFHILIDCGVILGTPNSEALMEKVVADIRETTGNKIDVLVGTHEHWDHISGFDPSRHLFDGNGDQEPFDKPFEIGQTWLAWTEDPKDDLANALRKQRLDKLNAFRLGMSQIRQRLKLMGLEEGQDEFDSAAEVLSFFGIDAKNDNPLAGGLGASKSGAGDDEGATGQAMNWLRQQKNVHFFKPGSAFDIGDLDVRVYVLGPPHDEKALRKDLPTKSGQETYEDDSKRAFASAPFFAIPLGLDATDGADDQAIYPFDQRHRISWEEARLVPFFRDHYFEGIDARDWRRIDDDWIGGAAEFALQLDSDTNNTSLVLAFELADGRVLLFPGDAQVGNWESWHTAPDRKTVEYETRTSGKVTAEHLLNRTVLYKVGHHGSHNATLRAKGLEMMTDSSLIALVPVDTYIAHCKKRWTKMPFNPLMTRLNEVTNGRVIKVDEELDPKKARAINAKRAPRDADEMIEVTQGIDDPDKSKRNEHLEERPLYVDVFIPLSK